VNFEEWKSRNEQTLHLRLRNPKARTYDKRRTSAFPNTDNQDVLPNASRQLSTKDATKHELSSDDDDGYKSPR
jgi:hypothetical protein